jgi:hypothetical protein
MSGVFRNIDPHPLTAWRVCTPTDLVRGEDTLAGWRGGGGSIVSSEDARHYSVLYILYVSTVQSVTHHVLKLLE